MTASISASPDKLTDECQLAYFAESMALSLALRAAPPSFPNRTRHRLATRDRLFDAALVEFRRVGVAAAQIEDIVRKAGVARGTFYLHFPTKDHVLMELMRRRQEDLADKLRRARSGSARTFLRRAADLMLEDARSEDTALWHELFAVLGRHAPELRTDGNALVEVVTTFFSAAQHRGEVRDDVSAFDLTSVLLPGILGLLQMRLDSPVPTLRKDLHRVVDIFVRGVTP